MRRCLLSVRQLTYPICDNQAVDTSSSSTPSYSQATHLHPISPRAAGLVAQACGEFDLWIREHLSSLLSLLCEAGKQPSREGESSPFRSGRKSSIAFLYLLPFTFKSLLATSGKTLFNPAAGDILPSVYRMRFPNERRSIGQTCTCFGSSLL